VLESVVDMQTPDHSETNRLPDRRRTAGLTREQQPQSGTGRPLRHPKSVRADNRVATNSGTPLCPSRSRRPNWNYINCRGFRLPTCGAWIPRRWPERVDQRCGVVRRCRVCRHAGWVRLIAPLRGCGSNDWREGTFGSDDAWLGGTHCARTFGAPQVVVVAAAGRPDANAEGIRQHVFTVGACGRDLAGRASERSADDCRSHDQISATGGSEECSDRSDGPAAPPCLDGIQTLGGRAWRGRAQLRSIEPKAVARRPLRDRHTQADRWRAVLG
jgi:hypothetical protein